MSWPANPINGQETTINGILYGYDATVGVWNRISQLSTSMGADAYSDSNVAIYLEAYSGNITASNISATTFTGTGNLTSLRVNGTGTFASSQDVTVSGTPSGTVDYDVHNGVVFDVAPTGNWTANIGNISTTNNRTSVVTFIITQGSTPYLPTVLQISGTTQTVNWINGSSPAGNANKIDVVSYSLIRSSAGAWTVLGQSATYG